MHASEHAHMHMHNSNLISPVGPHFLMRKKVIVTKPLVHDEVRVAAVCAQQHTLDMLIEETMHKREKDGNRVARAAQNTSQGNILFFPRVRDCACVSARVYMFIYTRVCVCFILIVLAVHPILKVTNHLLRGYHFLMRDTKKGFLLLYPY